MPNVVPSNYYHCNLYKIITISNIDSVNSFINYMHKIWPIFCPSVLNITSTLLSCHFRSNTVFVSCIFHLKFLSSRCKYNEVQQMLYDGVSIQLVALLYITVHYSTLQYITVHYSTLQYNTVHYSTLQYITVHYTRWHSQQPSHILSFAIMTSRA